MTRSSRSLRLLHPRGLFLLRDAAPEAALERGAEGERTCRPISAPPPQSPRRPVPTPPATAAAMFRRLTIRDFVIVDRPTPEFAAGFGALTGETGAGKSILLRCARARARRARRGGHARSSGERADVAAEFDLPAGEGPPLVVEQELPADEGMLILRRTIDAGGQPRVDQRRGGYASLSFAPPASGWPTSTVSTPTTRCCARRAACSCSTPRGAGRWSPRWPRATASGSACCACSAKRRPTRRARRASASRRLQPRELEQVGFDIEEWAEINAEHVCPAPRRGPDRGEAAVVALGEGNSRCVPCWGRPMAVSLRWPTSTPGWRMRELISAAAIQADEAL